MLRKQPWIPFSIAVDSAIRLRLRLTLPTLAVRQV
jgi:hypothetical protein